MNYISAKYCLNEIQINLDHVRLVSDSCGFTVLTFSNGDVLRLEDEPFAKFEEVLIEMQNERLAK
tara:strand:- start:46 stop:240 length:195 start_codon:yes stop_codon:yes gene_type:complete